MKEKMTTSKNGIELLKQFEGCVLKAYKPIPTEKNYTIGYGHNSPDIKRDMKITQTKAEELLKTDLKLYEFAVNNAVSVQLNQNQFDSLVCLVYNIGPEAFRQSTLLQKLNIRDYKGAADEFDKWIHAGGNVLAGLVRRRAAEKELFLRDVPPKPVTKLGNYQIKLGDTLSEIADKHETTVDLLLKLNRNIKNPHMIFTGQSIKVPK